MKFNAVFLGGIFKKKKQKRFLEIVFIKIKKTIVFGKQINGLDDWLVSNL